MINLSIKESEMNIKMLGRKKRKKKKENEEKKTGKEIFFSSEQLWLVAEGSIFRPAAQQPTTRGPQLVSFTKDLVSLNIHCLDLRNKVLPSWIP